MAKKSTGSGHMIGPTRSPGAGYCVSHPNLMPGTLGKGQTNLMTGGSKKTVIRSPMAPTVKK